ncbi:MAG TPA: hypothetical protein VKB92_02880 [Myxococcales bacterium]|nr:hypothetical protein [Myxococcales bacterium]
MGAAQRISRLLGAIDDLELRARRAAEFLGELSEDEAVEALDELLRRTHRRSDPHSAALEGLLRGLHAFVPEEVSSRLRSAADAKGTRAVAALFTRSGAIRSFDLDKEGWVDREMRARSLGARKALARGRNRDLLARLAQDQDPTVVRNLLENPRCTEREALVAASRRPVRTAVLQEVFRSRRWATNRRVRKALAQNPYSPPSLAISALAILTTPDLREIASDGTISPEVRVQARLLLAHRTGPAAE